MTTNSSGSGVHNNTHQRAHNHASIVTNGQRPLITSTYPGNNSNSRTADNNNNISRAVAPHSCHLHL